MTDDETSIQVLRAGSAIAIVFLVIYLAYDLWSTRRRIIFWRNSSLGHGRRGAGFFGGEF